MPVGVKVTGDLKRYRRALSEVQRREIPGAARPAINRTARSLRTRIARRVAAEAGVSVSVVRNRIQITTAKGRELAALLRTRFWPVPVIRLGARETRTGVTVRGIGKLAGRFIATMPSGHTGVFRRRGRERLPITEEKVRLQPGASAAADDEVRTKGPEIFRDNFEPLLERRLARKGLK